MKKILTILLLATPLLFVQCCKKKKTTETQTEVNSEQTQSNPDAGDEKIKMASIKIQKDYSYAETDHFSILDMRCSGDSLLVKIEYGGGCEKHVFTMFSNNLWLKSLPSQLTLYLEHESNNDMCRALITETIAFDLKDVRFPGGKELRIFINNDRSREVLYKY